MSNAYLLAKAGVIPPVIATTFVTDVKNDDGTMSPGHAIPSGNALNVIGGNTIQNNTLGIRTDANPEAGNNLIVELTNRVSVSTTTSDVAGQTQTVIVLPTVNGMGNKFRVEFAGIDVANNVITSSETLGISRTAGGTAVIVGTNEIFSEEDAALAATVYQVVASGANLELTFTGIAGHTINWRALFEYVQTP